MTTAQWQWTTLGFIIAVSIVAIGYDVLVIQFIGPRASISNVVCAGFRKFPILFALFLVWIGILCGHWFPVYTD